MTATGAGVTGLVTVSPELLEQTRAFNSELERLLATVPPVYAVPPEQTRRERREGSGVFPAPVFLEPAQTIEIEGPTGRIPLRVIVPERPSTGTFLHFHGGGWTLGENDMQDTRLARLAADTGLSVISVSYRLAPEHPYPAGHDDCEAAALWLLGSPQAEGFRAAGPLAIGGDSAGAHLSAVTLLRLRERHGILGRFEAAVLQYGAFDLSGSPSQCLWGERNLILSGPIVDWFVEQLLPGTAPKDRRLPDISPLYADLHGMPPAIFTVGTQDMLLDDTLFMEARWRMAGADTELRIYPEAPHGFLSLPMTVTDLALAAEHRFLNRTLGLVPSVGSAA
jgi:acetyl esterase/lipase